MLPARSFLILLLSIAAAATVIAQSQPPTFTSGNRTVAVYATVTNAAGRLMTDLERGQFEISDNGKRQELTLFSNDVQPITVVILLDRSGSMKSTFKLVVQAAEEFVAAMLPTDRALVGSFSTRIQIDPEDFTSDRAKLTEILEGELQGEGPTPLWNAVDLGITKLLRQQGRRVVLVFSDGVDEPMNFKSHNSSLRSVTKRAEENDVMVYAIGLSGDNAQPGVGRSSWPGAMGGRGIPRGGSGGGFFQRPFNIGPDPGLKDLAAATGGGYFELTSTVDLLSAFRRVANELHHQYALGFTPAALDGKMHELQLKINDARAVVRARKRYLADKPRT